MGVQIAIRGQSRLTRTGVWLVVMMFLILSTQIAVYFRDLGILDPRIIYGIRIVTNTSILGFAWSMMGERRLFKNNVKKLSGERLGESEKGEEEEEDG